MWIVKVNNKYTDIEKFLRNGTYLIFTMKPSREVLSGFIIASENLNEIKYEDDTVLISDTEDRLHDLL